jgi:hypothetical protein
MTLIQRDIDILQCPVGTAPTSPNTPTRRPRLTVDTDKGDFCESFAGSSTKKIPRIILLFAVRQFGEPSNPIQSRRGVIQGQTQRIQQSALASAGSSADGKKPG